VRIALVCPYSFTYPGGVKQHVLGLYQEFKKQKLYVKILTPKSQKAFPLKDIIFLGRSARLPSNYSSFDVSLKILFTFMNQLLSFSPGSFFGLQKQLILELFIALGKADFP